VASTGGPGAFAPRPGARQSPGTDESVVRGEVVND